MATKARVHTPIEDIEKKQSHISISKESSREPPPYSAGIAGDKAPPGSARHDLSGCSEPLFSLLPPTLATVRTYEKIKPSLKLHCNPQVITHLSWGPDPRSTLAFMAENLWLIRASVDNMKNLPAGRPVGSAAVLGSGA